MARKPRIHYPGALYHVILRGNDRQDIFFQPDNYLLWQSILIKALDRYGSSVHCFCWMTNHLHMMVQVEDEPLAETIRYAASQYSRKINLIQSRTGHLFERRHRAIIVRDDLYLKGLVRYIHNNPVRAGIVNFPGEYRWSSHAVYAEDAISTWVKTNLVRSTFGPTSEKARKAYIQFMAKDGEYQLSLYRLNENKDDAAVDDESRANIHQPWPDNCVRVGTLESIVQKHVGDSLINEEQLVGPGKARNLSELRYAIATDALESGAATVAEIARRLRRSESAISQLLSRRSAATRRKC